jgi:argininosuccinate lyase
VSCRDIQDPSWSRYIHIANERRLGSIIGKLIGGKLHTGWSRNEQVATDMSLWLWDELRKVASYLVDFLTVIAARREQEISLIMPGYTHLQRAQLIKWSHWILSYAMAFTQDLNMLREVIVRFNQSKPYLTAEEYCLLFQILTALPGTLVPVLWLAAVLV